MFCFNPKGVRTHSAYVRRDGQATDARTRIVIHGAASMANARTEPAFVSLAGTACTAPWRAALASALRQGRESAGPACSDLTGSGPASASLDGKERTAAFG